ncbi:MAG TPA: antibiotic biosynthesis monooxygenase [Puia sp.]|nr:antibiotic biosynthesis monooxygenase [Puia sp.]
MNEKQSVHFMKMSGDIGRGKEKEFEQTVRFVFNQLPDECIERSLAQDIFNKGHYSFYSVWHDQNSLFSFLKSEEFQLIRGAFDSLGHFENVINGKVV